MARTREKDLDARRMGASKEGRESASECLRDMKAIDFLRAASISSTTSPTALCACATPRHHIASGASCRSHT